MIECRTGGRPTQPIFSQLPGFGILPPVSIQHSNIQHFLVRIFFSVGEPSGDLHGANLIRALAALRPDVEFVGFGGPLMERAGCRLHVDLTALAVMGFTRVVGSLHKFLDLASQADRYFRHQRPDAVVLIDYPGFNWWIARRAKAHGIPVFYYTPPQIWAWASWRVAKMRRFVDHVLCSLPFEEPWFRERGCNAAFVGHPYFDEMSRQSFDERFADELEAKLAGRPLVAILPGSRTQEVHHNLPNFLRAAEHVRRQVPEARFAVAAFKPHQAEFARALVRKSGLDADVFLKRTPELIRAAHSCLACSGSVSLELLSHLKPTVIGYQVKPWTYAFQHMLRKVPYITLVNLLETGRIRRDKADERRRPANDDPRIPFPEFLTYHDRSAAIAEHTIRWLTQPAAHAATVARLEKLRARVAGEGASTRGARYIIDALEARPAKPIPRPHYLPQALVAGG